MDDQRVQIPGSAPKSGPNERWSSAADPGQLLSATVLLRRRSGPGRIAEVGEELLSGQLRSMPKQEALKAMSADPDDVAAVRSFLERHGLTVVSENVEARSLHIQGTVQQMNEAFGVELGWFEDANGTRYLSYLGPISVPESISGIVIAVLGLDQRQAAKHHYPSS